MTDRIMQIGNIVPPRKGFDNPQEGGLYSVEGVAPCLRTNGEYYIAVHE